jgi:hypothetical protein
MISVAPGVADEAPVSVSPRMPTATDVAEVVASPKASDSSGTSTALIRASLTRVCEVALASSTPVLSMWSGPAPPSIPMACEVEAVGKSVAPISICRITSMISACDRAVGKIDERFSSRSAPSPPERPVLEEAAVVPPSRNGT